MAYVSMTESELAAALADRRFIVLFRARRGSVERMSRTAVDARRPGRKAPLLSGMVVGSPAGGRVRVVDAHGHGGPIAVADAVYLRDPL